MSEIKDIIDKELDKIIVEDNKTDLKDLIKKQNDKVKDDEKKKKEA